MTEKYVQAVCQTPSFLKIETKVSARKPQKVKENKKQVQRALVVLM